MSGRNPGRGSGRNAPGRGFGRSGRGSGRYSGRGTYNRGYAVGQSEADSVKYYENMIITTNANINFTQLWKGAKTVLQNKYGDATKVLLRMDVDTEDPDPGPAPVMPRRAAYGNEVNDEREYQDEMNLWRDAKQDHAANVKEFKKQSRELNQKLEQIKNELLSKCDEDIKEYLEDIHTREVLYHIETPVTVVMDYIEDASMRGMGIDKRELKRTIQQEKSSLEQDGSMLSTETILEFKTRIKAFASRYNVVFHDKPLTEVELAEIFLNGLDHDRYGSFYADIKNKQNETCDLDATEEELRAFELSKNVPKTLQSMYDRCSKWKADPTTVEARPSTYAIEESVAATGGGNKTKPKKKSQERKVVDKSEVSSMTCWLCEQKGHHSHNCKFKAFAKEQIKKKIATEKVKKIDPELLKAIATNLASGNSINDGIQDYCLPMQLEESTDFLLLASQKLAEEKVVLHLWDTGSTLNLTPFENDLIDVKQVQQPMPLRTGNGINNEVRKVGENPLFGKTYVLESMWIRILSPGLIYNDPGYTMFNYATTGEIDVMHVNTSTIIPVRWHRGVLVASVPVSLYERCGVHPTETSASIELECSRN